MPQERRDDRLWVALKITCSFATRWTRSKRIFKAKKQAANADAKKIGLIIKKKSARHNLSL